MTTIPRSTLAHALALAVPATARDGIMANISLSTGRLTGTDNEIRVDVRLPEDTPTCLVSASRLSAICKSAPADADIGLEVDGKLLAVTAGRGSWRLPTADGSLYPSAADRAARGVCEAPAAILAAALASVAKCCDPGSSRYALGGVLLETRGGVLSVVATDGRRLSAVSVELSGKSSDETLIVPARSVPLVVALLADAATATVQRTASEVVLSTEHGHTVAARLIEGNFPRWRDAIPAPGKTCTITAGDLVSAVRQASIVTSEESRGVRFSIGGGGLTLSARSAAAGEATVNADLLGNDGVKATSLLDPQFVLQAIARVPPESAVTIQASKAGEAVVIRHETLTAVVMPLGED